MRRRPPDQGRRNDRCPVLHEFVKECGDIPIEGISVHLYDRAITGTFDSISAATPRAWVALDWFVRVEMSAWFASGGMYEQSVRLRELPNLAAFKEVGMVEAALRPAINAVDEAWDAVAELPSHDNQLVLDVWKEAIHIARTPAQVSATFLEATLSGPVFEDDLLLEACDAAASALGLGAYTSILADRQLGTPKHENLPWIGRCLEALEPTPTQLATRTDGLLLSMIDRGRHSRRRTRPLRKVAA